MESGTFMASVAYAVMGIYTRTFEPAHVAVSTPCDSGHVDDDMSMVTWHISLFDWQPGAKLANHARFWENDFETNVNRQVANVNR